MSIKKSLAHREKIKSRKPYFNREDWHKRRSISDSSWRKPRGKHSKMRHGFQGHQSLVNPGYGSPSDVRGLHGSGYLPIRVCNPEDLSVLDKSVHAVVIAATVGTKKKVEMVKKAVTLGLKIIGIKNPADYLKKIEEKMTSKKAAKASAEKTKKDKVKEKKAEPKKAEAEAPPSEDEAKKKETKEMEKVLTKRSR